MDRRGPRADSLRAALIWGSECRLLPRCPIVRAPSPGWRVWRSSGARRWLWRAADRSAIPVLAPATRRWPRRRRRCRCSLSTDRRRSARPSAQGRCEVGMILPLTQGGAPSPVGVSLRNAAQLAIDEFGGERRDPDGPRRPFDARRRGAGRPGGDRRGRRSDSRSAVFPGRARRRPASPKPPDVR